MTNEGNAPLPPEGLSPEDAIVFDRLADAGFDRDAMQAWAPGDVRRGERLLGLLGLLNDYPVDDADDTLVHLTLARIDRADADRADRMRFDPVRDDAPERSRWRFFRLPDLVTVASVILIASAVIIPLTSQLRQRAIDLACQQNLQQVALGLSQYAQDHGGNLPVARAGIGSSWRILDFAPLVAEDYCQHEDLVCPGSCTEHQGASYSRQVNQRPQSAHLLGAATTLVGDRNPLLDAFLERRAQVLTAASANHGGRGQHVLMGDNSVVWLKTSFLPRKDCIWLPEGHDRIELGVEPAGERDAFVVH